MMLVIQRRQQKLAILYAPKIMLTYVSLINEDDDDDDDDDENDDVNNGRDKFKVRIIEGLKRKNEYLKNEMQNDDDLRSNPSERNKPKQKTKTCDPEVQPIYKEGN